MKNTFAKKFTVCALAGVLGAAFIGCGDDGSSSPKGTGLPAEVTDKAELETYECSMDVIGEKVYVTELEENYECDGEKWFKSYDQTKPNSTKSSSSMRADGEGDDGDDENSLDSEKGSSSSVAPSDVASSKSKNGNSSSSSRIIASSSGAEQTSWPEGVKPSGYYAENCPASLECKDTTTSFEYLNQEILAAGKYGEILDTRDGQVYKTIKICDKENKNCQTWMAQNLNYRYVGVKYSYSGYTSDSTSWCYGNSANCDKYGRLYSWSAVMDSAARFSVNAETKCGYGKTCTPNSPHRGICPEGWHVPTNEEYSSLYKNIGGSNTAGSLLKSTSGWEDNGDKSGNGIDRYGFSVVPPGFKGIGGGMKNEHYDAVLWTASEDDSISAWIQYFYFDHDYAYQGSNNKGISRSLRCLKD